MSSFTFSGTGPLKFSIVFTIASFAIFQRQGQHGWAVCGLDEIRMVRNLRFQNLVEIEDSEELVSEAKLPPKEAVLDISTPPAHTVGALPE